MLSDGIVLIVAIINLVLTLSLGICAGLFCDYLYMQKLNELVKQGDMLDEEARLVFAQDKGGTSGKMVLAYFGLCIAASLVLTLAEIAMAGMNL